MDSRLDHFMSWVFSTHRFWVLWFLPLCQGFSYGCYFQAWDPARNADSQAPPGPAESETRGGGSTDSQGESDAGELENRCFRQCFHLSCLTLQVVWTFTAYALYL